VEINKLKLGNTYLNSEICSTFSCSLFAGMNKSNKTNSLVLISNHVKSIYADRWDGDALLYTGTGRSGDQTLKGNQNINLYESDTNGLTVYLFEVFIEKQYVYQGIVALAAEPFQEEQYDKNDKLRKAWVFPLRLESSNKPIDRLLIEGAFENKVRRISKKLSTKDLEKRARNINTKVGVRKTFGKSFQRNPYVTAYTLRRAGRCCELCNNPAPFVKPNGEPYLEVHHIKHLAEGGYDTIDNTVALCPNCHRKIHSLRLETDIDILLQIKKKV